MENRIVPSLILIIALPVALSLGACSFKKDSNSPTAPMETLSNNQPPKAKEFCETTLEVNTTAQEASILSTSSQIQDLCTTWSYLNKLKPSDFTRSDYETLENLLSSIYSYINTNKDSSTSFQKFSSELTSFSIAQKGPSLKKIVTLNNQTKSYEQNYRLVPFIKKIDYFSILLLETEDMPLDMFSAYWRKIVELSTREKICTHEQISALLRVKLLSAHLSTLFDTCNVSISAQKFMSYRMTNPTKVSNNELAFFKKNLNSKLFSPAKPDEEAQYVSEKGIARLDANLFAIGQILRPENDLVLLKLALALENHSDIETLLRDMSRYQFQGFLTWRAIKHAIQSRGFNDLIILLEKHHLPPEDKVVEEILAELPKARKVWGTFQNPPSVVSLLRYLSSKTLIGNRKIFRENDYKNTELNFLIFGTTKDQTIFNFLNDKDLASTLFTLNIDASGTFQVQLPNKEDIFFIDGEIVNNILIKKNATSVSVEYAFYLTTDSKNILYTSLSDFKEYLKNKEQLDLKIHCKSVEVINTCDMITGKYSAILQAAAAAIRKHFYEPTASPK